MSSKGSSVNINFANAWPLPGVRPLKKDSKKILKRSDCSERSNVNDENLNSVIMPPVSSSVINTSCNMVPNSFVKEEQKDDVPGYEVKCANGDQLAEGSISIDLEERKRLRRERQRIKKEAKKQERAMQREEELRKKRLAPKDQKVTIIDSSVLERFQVKGTQPARPAEITPISSTAEFPTLGEIMSSGCKTQSNRTPRRSETNGESSQDNKVIYMKQEASSDDTEINFVKKEEENCSVNKSPTVMLQNTKRNCSKNRNVEEIPKTIIKSEEISSGKRPKRKDLIQLDITEILKVKESKADNHVKQQKQSRKVEVARYSGNALDSDNPQMKRGKHREVPKPKKPSVLKQVILQDRAKRKESNLQNSSTNAVQICETDVPDNEHISNSVENTVSNELESKNSEARSKNSEENKIEKNISRTDFEKSNSGTDNSGDSILEEVSEDTDQSECVKEERTSEENKIDKDTISFAEASDNNSFAEIIADKSLKQKIHSRKFRSYCDHCILPEVLNLTTALLEDIVRFHDRQYARSPLKASAKRRHVTGLKEVRRFLALRKIRLLVIAPDLEPSGGLDEIVSQLKESAIVNGVPYVFALGRRQLGYTLKKKVPVSCVGILNYDGTEHNFRNLMSAVEKARELYKDLADQLSPPQNVANIEQSQNFVGETAVEDVNKEVIATLLAKLTETKEKENSSVLLEAIEKCAETDTDNATKGNEE